MLIIHVMFKMEDGTEDNERTSLLGNRNRFSSPSSVNIICITYILFSISKHNMACSTAMYFQWNVKCLSNVSSWHLFWCSPISTPFCLYHVKQFKLWTTDNLWSSLYNTKSTLWTLDYSEKSFLKTANERRRNWCLPK